jgi:hypothetical protein
MGQSKTGVAWLFFLSLPEFLLLLPLYRLLSFEGGGKVQAVGWDEPVDRLRGEKGVGEPFGVYRLVGAVEGVML